LPCCQLNHFSEILLTSQAASAAYAAVQCPSICLYVSKRVNMFYFSKPNHMAIYRQWPPKNEKIVTIVTWHSFTWRIVFRWWTVNNWKSATMKRSSCVWLMDNVKYILREIRPLLACWSILLACIA